MSYYIIVIIGLAVYGWYVVTRISKYRAASDLYHSSMSILEQTERDGIEAWADDSLEKLDEYTELKLKTKITAIEQRLDLLRKFYDGAEFTEDIAKLRWCLTIDQAPQAPRVPHKREIHYLIANMIAKLLEKNYAYINQKPWWPT